MNTLSTFTALTDIVTGSAPRILSRLCKHWSHHYATTCTADSGEVRFPDASVCRMRVTPGGLQVEVQVAAAAELPQLEAVVAEHLQRMAPKESLSITWRRL